MVCCSLTAKPDSRGGSDGANCSLQVFDISPLPLFSSAWGPSNGDSSPPIRATRCNTEQASSRTMLGSSSGGNQTQDQTLGQGHARQATAPAIPHKYGGAKVKLRVFPRRLLLSLPLSR